MKTKELIKSQALELFNEKGMRNVTLRDIAKALGRAYGNVTYHFPNKEELVSELYRDMLGELAVISAKAFKGAESLFHAVLEVPKHTFRLSMKYLFLFVDYVEIRRSFPGLAKEVDTGNSQRKGAMRLLLGQLQEQEYLRSDLGDQELDYLMELSGAMRTFFFIRLAPEDFEREELEQEYVRYVNQLLVPYLTVKGVGESRAFWER